MKYITNTIDYSTPASGTLNLSVIIGNGNACTSTFKNFDGTYTTGDITDVLLGNAVDIKGKSISVTSTVTDTNPNTDMTIITYQINDNDIQQYTQAAESSNDSVIYYTIINFK